MHLPTPIVVTCDFCLLAVSLGLVCFLLSRTPSILVASVPPRPGTWSGPYIRSGKDKKNGCGNPRSEDADKTAGLGRVAGVG